MRKGNKYTIDYWKSKGIKVYEEIPEGWIIIEGTLTQPLGTVWISNGESLFGGKYEHALLIVNKEGNSNENSK